MCVRARATECDGDIILMRGVYVHVYMYALLMLRYPCAHVWVCVREREERVTVCMRVCNG
jgi:hypothetical protein